MAQAAAVALNRSRSSPKHNRLVDLFFWSVLVLVWPLCGYGRWAGPYLVAIGELCLLAIVANSVWFARSRPGPIFVVGLLYSAVLCPLTGGDWLGALTGPCWMLLLACELNRAPRRALVAGALGGFVLAHYVIGVAMLPATAAWSVAYFAYLGVQSAAESDEGIPSSLRWFFRAILICILGVPCAARFLGPQAVLAVFALWAYGGIMLFVSI